MKRLIKFVSIGLVIAGAIATGGQASAVPEISKRTNSADSKIVFTFFGTPRTQIPVTIVEPISSKKTLKADECGLIVIPDAATLGTISVAGQSSIQTSSVLSRTAIGVPPCNTLNGSVILPSSPDNLWNIGEGKILSWVGPTSGSISKRLIDVSYISAQPKSRFVSLNGCGLGSIKTGITSFNSGNPTRERIGIGNTLVNMISVPDVPEALLCSGSSVVGASTTPPPDAFKDAANNITFFGTPNATISVGLEGAASSRSVTSDRCGGLTIGTLSNPIASGASFTIDSESIDTTGFATALKPTCKLISGSYAYDVVPSGNFRTPQGLVFLKNSTAKPSGFGDRRIYNLGVNGTSARSLKLNACGLGTIKSPATAPFNTNTSFTYNSQPYTVGGLTEDFAICKNAGTSSTPNWKTYRVLP